MKMLAFLLFLLIGLGGLATASDNNWERVNDTCWRLRVPNGWLVAVGGMEYFERSLHSITFYPDADHSWENFNE